MNLGIFYNPHKKIIFMAVAGIVGVGIIASGVFLFLNNMPKKSAVANNPGSASNTDLEVAGSVTRAVLPSLQTNPLENKPDLNTVNTTNPFRVAEKRAEETKAPETPSSPQTQTSTATAGTASTTATTVSDTSGNLVEVSSGGPGGCKTDEACTQYCDDFNHINECLSYAEKNNLITSVELADAKKAQSAIARGIIPPCSGKKCDTYCDENADQMEKCINFASQAGILTIPEIADARKVLEAVKKGVKPPCKGSQCDAFCAQPENMETCMNFAIEAGIMSESERADAKKVAEKMELLHQTAVKIVMLIVVWQSTLKNV